jgi:hypothetical protein
MPNLAGGTTSKKKKKAAKATPRAKEKASKTKRVATKAKGKPKATESGRLSIENAILSSIKSSLDCSIKRLDKSMDTLVQVGKRNKRSLTKKAENYEMVLEVPMKFNAQQLSKAIELAKLSNADQEYVRNNIAKQAASQVKSTIRAFVADVKPPETKHSLKSRS